MGNYYNERAQEFFEGTAYVDMSMQYQDFLFNIPKGGCILDAGCGSGRDSLFFKNLGYQVVAMDGSIEMCKLASEHIGQEVVHARFQEIDLKTLTNGQNLFDGIWAAASLLHVPSYEIESVLRKLKDVLKQDGMFYASFKYGDFEGERNDRYFYDLKEDTARALFTKVGFKVEKMWITGDVREGRGDEKWMNLLVRK